jgi:NAD(P)H dehydrogenase (quinone)
MGNILVLYDSKTGNTEKMAYHVEKGCLNVPGIEAKVLSIESAKKEDIQWCDGIAVGSPTNMGIVSWKMKRFWDEEVGELWGKIEGKIGCAFSTSGGWGGGAEITCMSILTILMNFGFLVFGITDYVGEKMTLHYGAVITGEPRTEDEIASCTRLGEKLAGWIAHYVDGKGTFQKQGQASPA